MGPDGILDSGPEATTGRPTTSLTNTHKQRHAAQRNPRGRHIGDKGKGKGKGKASVSAGSDSSLADDDEDGRSGVNASHANGMTDGEEDEEDDYIIRTDHLAKADGKV